MSRGIASSAAVMSGVVPSPSDVAAPGRGSPQQTGILFMEDVKEELRDLLGREISQVLEDICGRTSAELRKSFRQDLKECLQETHRRESLTVPRHELLARTSLGSQRDSSLRMMQTVTAQSMHSVRSSEDVVVVPASFDLHKHRPSNARPLRGYQSTLEFLHTKSGPMDGIPSELFTSETSRGSTKIRNSTASNRASRNSGSKTVLTRAPEAWGAGSEKNCSNLHSDLPVSNGIDYGTQSKITEEVEPPQCDDVEGIQVQAGPSDATSFDRAHSDGSNSIDDMKAWRSRMSLSKGFHRGLTEDAATKRKSHGPAPHTARQRTLIQIGMGKAHSTSGSFSVKEWTLGYRQRVAKIICSRWFDTLVGFVLVMNGITVGVGVDYSARYPTEDLPTALFVIELAFCVIFFVEICMRIFVFGFGFFFRQGWEWNVFDLFIVMLQVVEVIIDLIRRLLKVEWVESETSSSASNIMLFRVLRIVRLVRVLRFARVLRRIRELYNIVVCLVGSFRSFIWTATLYFLLMYVVGVYVTQIVSDEQRRQTSEDKAVRKYFGSLGNSIMSLFQAMTGGVDWDDLLVALSNGVGPTWEWAIPYFFGGYVAFTTFVMMNLVTGIFVESARANIRESKDLELVHKIRDVFLSSDTNQSGCITWEEFEEQLDNPLLEEFFKTIDLDPSEAQSFFNLIDTQCSNEISSEDFCSGCLRLRGPAKAIDLATLMYNIHHHQEWARSKIELLATTVTSLLDQNGRSELGQSSSPSSSNYTKAGALVPGKENGKEVPVRSATVHFDLHQASLPTS